MQGERSGPSPSLPIKVVVDSNVIVAAYFNPGSAAADVWQRARNGDLVLLWSAATRDEVLSVLEDVKVDPAFRSEVREAFRPEHRVVPQRLAVIEEDPPDNDLLACAVYGGAHAVITSDRHLLDLRAYHQVRLVTAGDFLNLYRPVHAAQGSSEG
ncbi:MAG TPA: putative toxin-antitoxin system toxin component, PIN family [Dehalococcoidia bacterium]